MKARAAAKVNLTLHVGPPRADGRHPLRSLTVFAPAAADSLSCEPDAALSLRVEGPMGGALSGEADESNLVLKAARALAAAAGREARGAFVLDKRLPVSAGLGGGSADAGAALRLLAAAWGLTEEAQLLRVAAGLGGDVPAAFLSRPVLMEGDGDRVTPVSGLAPLWAVLVNPGLACPTGPVFRAYDAMGPRADLGDDMPPAGPPTGGTEALIGWIGAGRNDLEAPAMALVPEIALVLDTIRQAGARLARMSGSGATCFGLWPGEVAAREAAQRIANAHPAWWVETSVLGAGA